MRNEFSLDRPKRILDSDHYDGTHAGLIRSIVKDFPAFRTAEKPNEWERGYHCVIDTLWHIANEFAGLEQQHESK